MTFKEIAERAQMMVVRSNKYSDPAVMALIADLAHLLHERLGESKPPSNWTAPRNEYEKLKDENARLQKLIRQIVNDRPDVRWKPWIDEALKILGSKDG